MSSDDDDYILLVQPYTTGGYAVMWQCELSKKGVPVDEPNRWWVDYTMNYNIVLEAAFQNKQSEALLEGPTSEEGDWKCCLQTRADEHDAGDYSPHEALGGHDAGLEVGALLRPACARKA